MLDLGGLIVGVRRSQSAAMSECVWSSRKPPTAWRSRSGGGADDHDASITAERTQWAARISAAWQKSVDSIIETGRLLLAAKADPKMQHGEWGTMVESDLPFNRHTAHKSMQIAGDKRLASVSQGKHLPPSWTTLYELTNDPCASDHVDVPTLPRCGERFSSDLFAACFAAACELGNARERSCNVSSFLLFDDDTFEHRSICRQFPLALRKAIGRKDVRDDVGVTLRPEAARATDRHLTHRKCE
jgi:hypothetical protein